MKHLWWLAAIVLAGCGGPTPTSGSPTKPVATEAAKPAAVQSVSDADLSEETRLALVMWKRSLKVGESAAKAEGMFPEQARAVESTEVPAVLNGDFRARSWERGEEGFGVVSWDGKVVAAMARVGKSDEKRLTEILNDHERLAEPLPASFQTGSRTRYWFWHDGPNRLMVCAFDSPNDGLQITVALGLATVLDALGASPEGAQKDALRLHELLPATEPTGMSPATVD